MPCKLPAVPSLRTYGFIVNTPLGTLFSYIASLSTIRMQRGTPSVKAIKTTTAPPGTLDTSTSQWGRGGAAPGGVTERGETKPKADPATQYHFLAADPATQHHFLAADPATQHHFLAAVDADPPAPAPAPAPAGAPVGTDALLNCGDQSEGEKVNRLQGVPRFLAEVW